MPKDVDRSISNIIFRPLILISKFLLFFFFRDPEDSILRFVFRVHVFLDSVKIVIIIIDCGLLLNSSRGLSLFYSLFLHINRSLKYFVFLDLVIKSLNLNIVLVGVPHNFFLVTTRYEVLRLSHPEIVLDY